METTSTKILKEIEHNIREPYDRSRGQIKQVIDLCSLVYEKTGKEISFDNSRGFNRYILILDGKEYSFNLYRDAINALEMILEII